MEQIFRIKKSLMCFVALMFATFLVSNVYSAQKPTISSLTPVRGPYLGGQVVVVTGSNFTSGLKVYFGGVESSTVFVSATELKTTTPAMTKGNVSVTVEGGSRNNSLAYEYTDLFENSSPNLPPDSNFEFDADAGDLDGDGDLDYVAASYMSGKSVRLYLNDGTGSFEDHTASANFSETNNCPTAIKLGDLDGDEDLDIFVAGDNRQDQLYLNNGDNPPTFFDATNNLPQELTMSWGACLGDFNKDGHLDIYVANGGADRLYVNDGNPTPTFSDASASLPPNNTEHHEDCTVGDVNGDGWDDVYISGWNTPNRLYLNNQQINPVSFRYATLPDENAYSTREVVLADLDGDGDLDVVAAKHNYEQNTLYINNGNDVNGDPIFIDYTVNLPQVWDSSHDVKAGDVDGDGDLDLIFANQNIYDSPEYPSPYLNNPQNTLYLNNGDVPPTFFDATETNMPVNLIASWDVILGDMDNDNDLDIIFTNDGDDKFYLNLLK